MPNRPTYDPNTDHGDRDAALRLDALLEVWEDGALVATAPRLNFTGAGVAVAADVQNRLITITISGGGGGVSDNDYGDITVSGSASVWTIDNGAVTYAKMQDISATQRVLGRNSGGSGDPEEVTAAQVLAWIGNTQGQLLYRDGSGWTVLAPGSAGEVLTTGGAGANPSWAAAAGGASAGLTTALATSKRHLGYRRRLGG